MTKEPEVQNRSSSEREVRVDLKVPEDLVFTEGHFEEAPIVPGVVLVDWAMDRARDAFSDLGTVEEIKKLKFTEPLQPGDTCQLTVEWDRDQETLSFTFSDEDDTFANGRLAVTKAGSGT